MQKGGVNMENIYNWKPEIQQLVDEKGFREYTPIQKKTIPLILKGRDVIGISATGTGKSHAFILPLLQKVDTSLNSIQVIITAPTRELARQLYNQVSEINDFDPSYRIKLISSGLDKQRMMDSLNTQPHIVVGTVGRTVIRLACE